MGSQLLQTIAGVAVVATAALVLQLGGGSAGAGGLSGDSPRITAAQRDATARFAAGVPEADRAWIEAAVAMARPEARRLIAEVDGLVEYQVHRGDPLGVTRSEVSPAGARFAISFDVASLDSLRRQDRAVTVLHELGHAIDLALVPQATNDALEAGIPRMGACGSNGGAMTGACAEPAERFADTFAKWALRGSVSAVGAGYEVANPPSLEDWGAPLAALSIHPSAPR